MPIDKPNVLACWERERKVVNYLFPIEQLYSFQQLKMDEGKALLPPPPPDPPQMSIVTVPVLGTLKCGRKFGAIFAGPFREDWKDALLRTNAAESWLGCSFFGCSLHQYLCLGTGWEKSVNRWVYRAQRWGASWHVPRGCAFKQGLFVQAKTSLAFCCFLCGFTTVKQSTMVLKIDDHLSRKIYACCVVFFQLTFCSLFLPRYVIFIITHCTHK